MENETMNLRESDIGLLNIPVLGTEGNDNLLNIIIGWVLK
jgi:hypothetical protein